MWDHAAKTLSTMLVDECDKQYGYHPGDDATACVVRIRKREPMNLCSALQKPRRLRPHDVSVLLQGRQAHYMRRYHIFDCGKISRKAAKASLSFERSDVPPIAEIEGVDLVTEGVITINKVIEYAEDALGDNEKYGQWSVQRDGASLIARMLLRKPPT